MRPQAKGLTIDVHEWPLPERALEAKAAVFELDVPTVVFNSMMVHRSGLNSTARCVPMV